MTDSLKPYLFHGLNLTLPKKGGKEATGDCPFCGSEKFSVNVESSLFQCWRGSCGTTGNSSSFLKELWSFSLDSTTKKQYELFSHKSGFLDGEQMKAFGCVKSIINGNWLVPGYNTERKMTGLYQYMKIKNKQGAWNFRLLPTPTLGHHLFNLLNYVDDKPNVSLLEGWRDSIRWMEWITTEPNYDTDTNVIGTPGASVFKPEWYKFFSEKEVTIMFDHDKERIDAKTKKKFDGAGTKGIKRVCSVLMSSPSPPSKISFIDWSTLDVDLKDGLDVRDFLNS